MRKTTLLLCFLSMTTVCGAQVIKIDNGATINSLHGKDIDQFKDKFTAYAGQVGIEYLDHRYFYLSSAIGYLKLGGEAERPIGLPGAFVRREDWSYIHLNTIVTGRITVSRTELFAGFGPYLNLLAGENKMKNALYAGYSVPRTNWGGRLEAGINETAGRMKIGVYAAYLVAFSPTVKTPYTSWDARSLGVYAAVGYRLK